MHTTAHPIHTTQHSVNGRNNWLTLVIQLQYNTNISHHVTTDSALSHSDARCDDKRETGSLESPPQQHSWSSSNNHRHNKNQKQQ